MAPVMQGDQDVMKCIAQHDAIGHGDKRFHTADDRLGQRRGGSLADAANGSEGAPRLGRRLDAWWIRMAGGLSSGNCVA
jgi:hypothetical protein